MASMLSRIADSLFWLARYIGRAEYTARILDVNYYLMLEQAPAAYQLSWEPLLRMAGEQEAFKLVYQDPNAETVFDFLAFRRDNPNSIVECVARARENARTIRDRISREMWEDINGLYHTVLRFSPEKEFAAGPHRFCDMVRYGAHRFHGVTDATLTHDDGWEFLRIGAALEQAEMTTRLADVQCQDVPEAAASARDTHQWMAVLRSVGAFEAYRRAYRSGIEPEKVAEMMILHPQHPGSIRFCTTEIQAGLRAISGTGPGSYSTEAERFTGKVLESLRYATIEEIFERGLHDYLGQLQRNFSTIGRDIGQSYFYYAAVS
jgi:uncharacterized alpha-E superfamily protein